MRVKHIAPLAGVAALAMMGTAAQARMQAEQPAPPAQPPAQADQLAPAISVSAGEIDKFAKVVIGIEQLRAQNAQMQPQDQQQAIMSLLQQNGLEPRRFAQIAQTSRTDQELHGRIQARVQEIAQQG